MTKLNPCMYWYIQVCTGMYGCVLISIFRVGEGTVTLATVVYIDGSFIRHKIPVKPIYVTICNLNSNVSGKACAWRVMGMMPSLKKSSTLDQTDTWHKERRLRLHHACIANVALYGLC